MVNIRIPATSANMGPGFDCLGIALNLYNYFFVEEIEHGLLIEGCDKEFATEDNLVYKAMKRTFEILGYSHKGIRIKMDCRIPISRGLGSSAACILAGVIGASKIAEIDLDKNKILEISTLIEGHPDNIAPALFGGMVVSILNNENVYWNKVNIANGLKFFAIIPEFTLATSMARKVLPHEIPYKDAVFNIGRVSVLLSSLISGNFKLLGIGCEDKLHEDYRSKLIENYDDIVNKSKKFNCLGVFLSGAGPTIMTIVYQDDNNFYYSMDNYLKSLNKKWTIHELNIDKEGAVY